MKDRVIVFQEGISCLFMRTFMPSMEVGLPVVYIKGGREHSFSRRGVGPSLGGCRGWEFGMLSRDRGGERGYSPFLPRRH